MPRNGSGEDGLTKALEQRRDAVDAGFQGIDLGQQFVELGGDAGLLCIWCKPNRKREKTITGHIHSAFADSRLYFVYFFFQFIGTQQVR